MGVAFKHVCCSHMIFLGVVSDHEVLPTMIMGVVCYHVVFFSRVVFSVNVGVVSSHVIWCDLMGVAFNHVLFMGVVSHLKVQPTSCYHVVFFSHAVFSVIVGVAFSHVVGVVRISSSAS